MNHGGHVNTLTAPNAAAQADLIIEACEKNQIQADSISYIEAHGTGTSLGTRLKSMALKKHFKH